MSNVVPMEQTCEYLVTRARRHRLAGRYDEAMTLLTRAKEQYGSSEAVEMELARTYDEMGCEEEAARCYLRVVRAQGECKAEALFQLAVSAAQRADLTRAASYLERFSHTDRKGVSLEMAQLLDAQIRDAMDHPILLTRKGRARALERRAVERLQAGKAYAAARTMRHALALYESAQGYTLLACCALLLGKAEDAVRNAEKARNMAPGRVQTLCVLADAYLLAGEEKKARRALYLVMMRANDMDSMFNAAMESAKHGEDGLTLLLTRRLLRRDPYHTRAMMMRACALTNRGKYREANRLFGRLCRLTPEDTVCDALYRMTREEKPELERLILGLDVPRQEAVSRTLHLISALYADHSDFEDAAEQRVLCRDCAWAMRSAQAGAQTSIIALMIMGAMDTPMSREVLLDALTDPQLPDKLKIAVLQTMTAKTGIQPYDVDLEGKFMRLVAGAQADCPPSEAGQRVVQRAADALSGSFPDVPKVILPIWVNYLNHFGPPEGRYEDACSAALVCIFHEQNGNPVELRTVAERFGVSGRLCALMLRRIRRAQTEKE